MKTRLFLIIFIVLLITLGTFKTALAQDDCEGVDCCCHTHYDCRGSCQTYTKSAPNYSGGTYQSYWTKTDCYPADCCGGEGGWILEDKCKGWESCSSNGQPTSCCRGCGCNSGTCPTGSCQCNGPYCVFPPTISFYYDNQLYPQLTPTQPVSPSNIYLPVKLDWDDVNGWYNGGHNATPDWFSPATMCTPALGPDGGVDCVDSYKIIINDLTASSQVLNKALPKSEYNYREPAPLGDEACFLKSNHNYSWQVQACCNADGTNCSPSSTLWSFYTNPAPEPIGTVSSTGTVTMDPDWNGLAVAKNIPLPAKLIWCSPTDSLLYHLTYGALGKTYYNPLSYNFKLDYNPEPNVTNTDRCYPRLIQDGVCRSLVLTADRSAGELLVHNEFCNYATSSLPYHYLTKLTSYGWKVSACREISGSVNSYSGPGRPPLNVDACTDYSQYWKFSVKDFTLVPPKLIFPSQNEVVGLPLTLEWTGSPETMSYLYSVAGVSGKTTQNNLTLDQTQLSADTSYSWTITPCWDFLSLKCEFGSAVTGQFKTGSGAVNLISPPNGAKDVPVPVELVWEAAAGAKAYVFSVEEKDTGESVSEDVVYSTGVYLNFPNVKTGTEYLWYVKSCTDESGLSCKAVSAAWTFTTFKLDKVKVLSPTDGQQVFTAEMPMNISWQTVPFAKFYQYEIYYVSKAPEETAACPTSSATAVSGNTVSQTSDNESLVCLGDYILKIRACLDQSCTDAGDYTILTFMVVQGSGGGGGGGGGGGMGGLVPCGKFTDNPDTPWNERDKCEIKHLFLLIKIIIDFLLWKLGIILLVVLVALSGAIYYFSMGSLEAVSQVKLIWKAAGIGYGILFLGWLIINLFLMLLGYNAGIFGPWYQFNI